MREIKKAQSAATEKGPINNYYINCNIISDKNKAKQVRLVSEEDIQDLLRITHMMKNDIYEGETKLVIATLERLENSIKSYMRGVE